MDVGIAGKLVNSACYDTQQVCVYLQNLPVQLWRVKTVWRRSEQTRYYTDS